MNKKHTLGILLWMFIIFTQPFHSAAQESPLSIAYGETTSGFLTTQQLTQMWSFSGTEHDIVQITAHRIGGLFTPHIRLFDANGTLLAENPSTEQTHVDEIIFSAGLPVTGEYRIEVTSASALTDRVDNPNEYSLTLNHVGTRRIPLVETLPTIGTGSELPPELASSTFIPAENNPLDIPLYNALDPVRQPDTAELLNGYLVTGSSSNRQITVSNAVPISRGIAALSVLDDGLGFISLTNAVFFTDRPAVTLSTTANGTVTITLPGEVTQTIVTDFYSIVSIQAVNDLVVVRMANGQRLILSGSFFNLHRRVGQAGNDEPVFEIFLDENRFVNTDLAGWHTLAYFDGQLHILYGEDSQLISDQVRLDVFQNNQVPEFSDIALYDTVFNNSLAPTTMLRIDWLTVTGIGQIFGDVIISESNLRILPRDGRDILENLTFSEDRRAVTDVLIEHGAVRIHRLDGSYRLSLPDATEVATNPSPPSDVTAPPYGDSFTPMGLNNLGIDPFPSLPSYNVVEDNLPVNPINGNFYYWANDFHIPSHTLELNFERYYNSQADSLTPSYMLQSNYPLGQIGYGWRHSYQYEINISQAPFGQLTLILPQGTRHIFNVQDNGTTYRSRTLLSWSIERVGGILGSWVASSSDGVQYHFDRGGRLERITDVQGHALTFSPAPRNYLTEGQASGTFIIEPYGRRLELYVDDRGYVSTVRDTLSRQVTYTYNVDTLVAIQYMDADQTARYTYNDQGMLIAFDDAHSPYHQRAVITYESRRVTSYVENPDGIGPRTVRYNYDTTQLITTRTSEVTTQSGAPQLRNDIWQYDAQFLVISYTAPKYPDAPDTPRPEFTYTYSYDRDSHLLTAVRQPDMTTFRFVYDAQAYLTQLRDPIYTDTGYEFVYETRGNRQLLQMIRYPNGGRETFVYDDTAAARLIEHHWLLTTQSRDERIQRFIYDEWGRISTIINAGSNGEDVATVYTYDDFGYVSSVRVGESWQMSFRHDLLGRLRSVIDGNGNNYSLDWLSTQDLLTAIYGPEGYIQTFGYDNLGRLIEWVDRGNSTRYSYNDLNQVSEVINAEGQQSTYTYDEANNLLSASDSSGRTYVYSYDALNNLTSETTPSGLVSTYEYALESGGNYSFRRHVDPAGNITVYRYDALGRLRRITLITGEHQQAYSLSYDAVGNMTDLTDEFTGRNLRVDYNLVGQVVSTSIENVATTYIYDAAGNLLTVTDPSGVVTTYSHDVLGNVVSVFFSDGTQINYSYDGNSNLVSMTDTLGRETSYVYDALNRVTNIVEPGERITQFSYDVRSNLVSVTDPLGNTTSATYNALDHITSLTDPLGNDTRYDYDDLGRLTRVSAPLSFTTQYAYNIDNNIVAITQPSGRQTIYDYDVLGRLTSVTDALGHTYVYSYNEFGSLASVTDPLGNTSEYGWSNGRPGSFIDGSGRGYDYNPDMIGRVVTIRDGAEGGPNLLFEYDAAGRITEISAGTDRLRSNSGETEWRYLYDPARGWLQSYTDPLGFVWTVVRDGLGRVIELQNPDGTLTRYEYDAAGNINRIIRAAGAEQETSEQFVYDANRNVVQHIAVDGIVTSYVYDANNQLVEMREAVGTALERAYTYEYDAAGHLTRIVDPLGRETVYRYDPFGNLTRALLSGGTQYEYSYDLMGNLIGVTFPEGQQVNISYDALNRRVRYVDAANGVWAYTYDSAGNLTQVSDPLGNVTRYEYDVYNRLARLVYPDGAVVSLTYDQRGNFQSVIAPATGDIDPERTEYTIDPAGNLVTIVDNADADDPARTRLQYDAFGRVISRETATGDITQYRYDTLGNIVEITYPDASTQTRVYDSAGRLTSITAPTGIISFAYDALGRLTTTQAGGTTLTYTYDSADNLLTRDAGENGAIIYTYDAADRPVHIQYGEQTIELVYDGNGWRTQLVRSNDSRTNYTYDANGRPQVITHIGPDGVPLDGFSYTYDPVGNLTRMDRIDSWAVLYNYNASQRIIDERWLDSANDARYTISLSYDNAGNIIDAVRDGEHTEYIYGEPNQLISIDGDDPAEDIGAAWVPLIGLLMGGGYLGRRHWRRWLWITPIVLVIIALPVLAQEAEELPPDIAYTYREDGNLLQIIYGNGNTLSFSYDYENRLTNISGTNEDGVPINVEMTYDALGRLVQWQNNGQGYRLIYDGETLIATENLLSTDGTEYFVPFPGEIILSTFGDINPIWTLQDATQSTKTLMDDTANLLPDHFDFNVFGQLIDPYQQTPNIGTMPVPMFAGELYDPNTELYIGDVRVYDPLTNRFLQRSSARHFPRQTLYGAFVPPVMDEPQSDIPYRYLYDGTFAPLILDSVQPQTEFGSLLSSDSVMPTTAQLQADENVRLLRLVTRLSVSPSVVANFLNPLPSSSTFDWSTVEMLTHYTPGVGWLPNNTPDPLSLPSPVASLVDAQEWLTQSGAPIIVQPAQPNPFASTLQVEAQLPELLQEVQIMTGLLSEVEMLNNIQPAIALPSIPVLGVDIPQPRSVPPALIDLYNLYRPPLSEDIEVFPSVMSGNRQLTP